MTMLIQEPSVSHQIIQHRQSLGIDGYDEVWEGVYVVTPLANLKHQDLVSALHAILFEVVCRPGRGRVQPGANVSDREEHWKDDYRVPDIVVVLNDSRARDCGTHWFGGPDFLVEIVSPQEDALEQKRAFYERIAVRELLTIHRDTRRLSLYRLLSDGLVLVGRSDSARRDRLSSDVLALTFQWTGSEDQPQIKVQRTDREGDWSV